MRVLILGGYGTFGSRLVQLLADEPGLTLLVGGRSLPKAHAFCYSTPAKATLEPARIDRDGDLAERLAFLKPALVVDASGPFQAYGERPYRLVEACLDAGIPYLDLADGSDFVAGISRFDEGAKAKGIFILAGASSFPTLSAAVVRRLGGDLAHIDTVEAGIAPSPHAIVGLNVIRAIASYAGRPTKLRREGGTATAYPFTEQRRRTVAPPGAVPLHSTLFSLVDAPDLQTMPELWPELRSVWLGAGPRPAILHRMLIALAWARRWKLLPPLTGLAPLMQGALGLLRGGEHRGGMYVEVTGRTAEGEAVQRGWHLVAEGEAGRSFRPWQRRRWSGRCWPASCRNPAPARPRGRWSWPTTRPSSPPWALSQAAAIHRCPARLYSPAFSARPGGSCPPPSGRCTMCRWPARPGPARRRFGAAATRWRGWWRG